MKQLSFLALPFLVSLPALAAQDEGPVGLEPGTDAPAIQAERWYNHVGQSPDVAALRGQAVLIEFWATW